MSLHLFETHYTFIRCSPLTSLKIGPQCECVPRERDCNVMAGGELTWRHNVNIWWWPLQPRSQGPFSTSRKRKRLMATVDEWDNSYFPGLACTKTRNTETKPSERNHRDRRKHRNKTTETLKRNHRNPETKPAKPPKKLLVSKSQCRREV